MIFRFVSIRQFIPFSILSIVSGDTPAFLANSALLIRSSSLIFFTIFRPNFSSRFSGLPRCTPFYTGPLFYIYDIICQVFFYKLTKFYIIRVYKGWYKKNDTTSCMALFLSQLGFIGRTPPIFILFVQNICPSQSKGGTECLKRVKNSLQMIMFKIKCGLIV